MFNNNPILTLGTNTMRNLLYILIFSLLLPLPVWSQSKEIYVHPNFKSLARGHQAIAVLPFKFRTTLRKKKMEGVTEDQLKMMEQIDGSLFQSELYEYLKKREEAKGLKVTVQNVNKTNSILEENGVTFDNKQNQLDPGGKWGYFR